MIKKTQLKVGERSQQRLQPVYKSPESKFIMSDSHKIEMQIKQSAIPEQKPPRYFTPYATTNRLQLILSHPGFLIVAITQLIR